MTREIWKPIPGWEHYSVSNLGNVRTAACKPLKVNIDTGGYAQVKLYPVKWSERTWTVVVHRLVLATFRRLPRKGEHGMHRNDIRSDNRLTNLSWGTKKQNANDMAKKGRVKNSPRKRPPLTPAEIVAIQACPNESLANLALRFGTSKSTVSKTRAKALKHRNHETPIVWRKA